MEIAKSVNGVPIRLTDERWMHVVENHCELAGHYHEVLETVANPDLVIKGFEGELLALKKKEGKKYMIVAYKEVGRGDGFIITAFFSSKVKKLLRREILWKREEH
jgi:hypothetical protein